MAAKITITGTSPGAVSSPYAVAQRGNERVQRQEKNVKAINIPIRTLSLEAGLYCNRRI